MFLSVKDLEGARGGTHTTSRRKTEPRRPGDQALGLLARPLRVPRGVLRSDGRKAGRAQRGRSAAAREVRGDDHEGRVCRAPACPAPSQGRALSALDGVVPALQLGHGRRHAEAAPLARAGRAAAPGSPRPRVASAPRALAGVSEAARHSGESTELGQTRPGRAMAAVCELRRLQGNLTLSSRFPHR